MGSYGRAVVGYTTCVLWDFWGLLRTCEEWRGLKGSFGASSVFFWMVISEEKFFKCEVEKSKK